VVALRPAAGGAQDVSWAVASIETARGTVRHSWRREGGAQCGKAARGDSVTLDCGASGGVIEEVRLLPCVGDQGCGWR
jgi:hypothetical protein